MIIIGDKVVAPMPYGYAPVHGTVVDMWINKHGVEMAQVYYGNGEYKPTGRHTRICAVKSLRRERR